MFIAILGRQPEISIAELEAVYGAERVKKTSSQAATIDSDNFSIDKLGGTIKCGHVVSRVKSQKSDHHTLLQASKVIAEKYAKNLSHSQKKITFGISFYGNKLDPRNIQKIGIILKNSLKKSRFFDSRKSWHSKYQFIHPTRSRAPKA